MRAVRDVTMGFDSSQPDHVSRLPVQSGHMITFVLENNLTITFRTSGTEPKIKFYSELISSGSTASERQAVDEQLRSLVTRTVEDLMQPAINGLVPKKD